MRLANLPGVAPWLRRWSARRAAVDRLAEELLARDPSAYYRARNRARRSRERGDAQGDRFWSPVARAVARRTGKVIGESAADRWMASK